MNNLPFVLGCMAMTSAFSQSPPIPVVIVDAKPSGHLDPLPISPGQLLTLLVRGITTEPAIAPEGQPLPTEMNCLSVTMEDLLHGLSETQIPIMRIDWSGCGSGLTYICDVRAITVQVPQEFLPPSATSLWDPVLRVWVDGQPGMQTEFRYAPSQISLLTECSLPVRPGPRINMNCLPMVGRPDGTVISWKNRAQPGEVVSIWAIGLGRTSPPVPFGEVTPDPPPPTVAAPIVRVIATDGYLQPIEAEGLEQKPVFTGLLPGKVGIYQIQVRIPEQLHPDAFSCGPDPPYYSTFNTNTRLEIGPQSIPNRVNICVQKPGTP